MKLSSFRELLLRKVEDDPVLQTLIKCAADEIIADAVVESLEKMAISEAVGRNPSPVVAEFATKMMPHHPEMIRSALGHHFSHAAAAHKSGNESLANKHMHQALKIMHVAQQAQKHSMGNLAINYVDIKPWERSKYEKQYEADHPHVQGGRYKPGDFTTKTKGLSRVHGTKDVSWLFKAPSSKDKAYIKEVSKHGHNKTWPAHETAVNGKHVFINHELESPGTFQSHEFDNHPILKHHKSHDVKGYSEALDTYYNQPHAENWFARREKLKTEDPEKYEMKVGGARSEHHPCKHIHDNPDFKPLDIGPSPLKGGK